jgi:hypothetical protein
MKPVNLICSAAFGLIILAFVSACNNKCDGIACVTGPPFVILDLRDAQNRDLLNPATPGHYDTAQIRQLNNGEVRVFPAGAGKPSKDHFTMAITLSVGQNTKYLQLSSADQDTILTNIKSVTSGCCTGTQLDAFSYNSKANTDSLKSQHFIVVK